MKHVIISREILQLLVLDNRSIFTDAHDRDNGELDAKGQQLGNGQAQDGCISSLLREHRDGSTLHSDSEEMCEVDPESLYIEIGDDDPADVQQFLDNMLSKAVENSLCKTGTDYFHEMLDTCGAILRTRLGTFPPTLVEPMRIRLQIETRQVRLKYRRYSPRQHEFVNTYRQRLIDMHLVEERPTAPWQAAPLVVLKPGKRTVIA